MFPYIIFMSQKAAIQFDRGDVVPLGPKFWHRVVRVEYVWANALTVRTLFWRTLWRWIFRVRWL